VLQFTCLFVCLFVCLLLPIYQYGEMKLNIITLILIANTNTNTNTHIAPIAVVRT